MIRHIRTPLAALAASLLAAGSASAGVFTDDLSKCLVKSATSADQTVFVQWMFSAVALNPAVQGMVSVSQAQRDGLNRQMANLLVRLVSADCRSETVAALKSEGAGALSTAFEVLGETAGRGLMSDPHVTEGLKGFAGDIDRPAMTSLFKDAGLAYDDGVAKTN